MYEVGGDAEGAKKIGRRAMESHTKSQMVGKTYLATRTNATGSIPVQLVVSSMHGGRRGGASRSRRWPGKGWTEMLRYLTSD